MSEGKNECINLVIHLFIQLGDHSELREQSCIFVIHLFHKYLINVSHVPATTLGSKEQRWTIELNAQRWGQTGAAGMGHESVASLGHDLPGPVPASGNPPRSSLSQPTLPAALYLIHP